MQVPTKMFDDIESSKVMFHDAQFTKRMFNNVEMWQTQRALFT